MDSERRLTKLALAARYSVSVRTIERQISQGLPFIPVGRRCKRFDVQAVEEWLRKEGWRL